MTRQESNLLIAEFMGYKILPNGCVEWEEDGIKRSTHNDILSYHESWDSLMSVFYKIESLENGSWKFSIDPWEVQIIDYSTGNEEVRAREERSKSGYLLPTIYETIVQFITWYNTQANGTIAKTFK